MPSPVSPQTLQELVPPRNGSFCGRWIPGIINWLQERANFYRWMYKDNGDLTVSYLTDLCIAKNGTITPDPTTCPPMSFTASIKSRNELLKLVFTGTGISDGFAWSLYRSTSISGPWGAAITTGTTSGATISYDDSTGLANDTTYYYRLQVTRPGCPVYSLVASGTPKECQTYNLQINVTSPAENAITVTIADLDGELQPGSTWEISVVDGDVLGSGIVGTDGNCTVNGRPGVCFSTTVDTSFTDQIIIQAVIQQGACAAYTLTQGVVVNVTPLPAPTLFLANSILSWSPVDGAGGYRIWALSLSECAQGGPFPIDQPFIIAEVGTSPRTHPVSRQQFPANTSGPLFSPPIIHPPSQYRVWVVALRPNGQPGFPSNMVSINAWLGGQFCGT